ncbi:helix-turn-helix domain-containing protein [Gymnodinialimonas hymeniacidonis]|uniref:helix-turn-helix domain-containing protein n=1 Tax=Gymnodinialimonas hymeniacidonis TaxID=3126508 RepID=UPI0034C6B203
MNAVSLLCEIIGQTGKVAAQACRDDAGYGALLDAGLLKGDGLVEAVLCENCDVAHDAEIVFEGGSYGHFCPELGFVSVEREDIVAIRPDISALVEHLRAAFECPPGGISQLGPRTWRVGLADTPGGRAVVYFHTCLQNDDDLVSLENALRAEIRRDYVLVVTAAGHLPYREAATCTLAQLVQLDLGTAHLRNSVSVAEAVGAPPTPTGGRPSVYRERLQALLAERAAQGLAEDGRNEEAAAVLNAYVERFPRDAVPSRVTVQRSVTRFRAGS